MEKRTINTGEKEVEVADIKVTLFATDIEILKEIVGYDDMDEDETEEHFAHAIRNLIRG